MPTFAKCYNPECFSFGQWQEATGSCRDCGAPLHLAKEGLSAELPEPSLPAYLVLLSGPEPISVPVMEAANDDDAAAKALGELERLGQDPHQFRVEQVYARFRRP